MWGHFFFMSMATSLIIYHTLYPWGISLTTATNITLAVRESRIPLPTFCVRPKYGRLNLRLIPRGAADAGPKHGSDFSGNLSSWREITYNQPYTE